MSESEPRARALPPPRPSLLGVRAALSAAATGRRPLPPLSRESAAPRGARPPPFAHPPLPPPTPPAPAPRALSPRVLSPPSAPAPRVLSPSPSPAPSPAPAPRVPARGLGVRASGMQERRIMPRGAPASEAVGGATAAAKTESPRDTAEALTQRVPSPENFSLAMEVLNRLLERDRKDTDRRAWVTRYAEDNASARFSKEELLPIWFLVNPDALLIIDINGTAHHSNYVGPLDFWDVESKGGDKDRDEQGPCKVVSSMLEPIRHGEVRLPQNSAEAAAAAISPNLEFRWGEPIGVLIKSPVARMSILRDICQMYIPSFLQRAYPHGVPLKGHWSTASFGSDASSVLRIPPSAQMSLLTALRECGTAPVNAFTGIGVCSGDSRAPVLRERCASAPQVVSPWKSCERQTLFTARLVSSSDGGKVGRIGGKSKSANDAAVTCLAVLVLTPRGPLELLVETPGMQVTVRDLKSSLVRSGVGRSMRVLQSAVQFRYAPGLPLLDDCEVIDARYAVLRLQMRR